MVNDQFSEGYKTFEPVVAGSVASLLLHSLLSQLKHIFDFYTGNDFQSKSTCRLASSGSIVYISQHLWTMYFCVVSVHIFSLLWYKNTKNYIRNQNLWNIMDRRRILGYTFVIHNFSSSHYLSCVLKSSSYYDDYNVGRYFILVLATSY